MEIGVDSFAAILPDPTGRLPSATDRMADLLDEVEIADRVGLDVFGIGEHHRDVPPNQGIRVSEIIDNPAEHLSNSR